MLHRTIEKVASHRGWGVQDARFARMHLEEGDQEGKGREAFRDYNTFVKTMRSALISPAMLSNRRRRTVVAGGVRSQSQALRWPSTSASGAITAPTPLCIGSRSAEARQRMRRMW